MDDQIEAILALAKNLILFQDESGVYFARVSPSPGRFFWRKNTSLSELLNQGIKVMKEWEGE